MTSHPFLLIAGLNYLHDHSDSLWDSFEFAMSVDASGGVEGSKGELRMSPGTVFNITIIPINDQEFR